MTDRPAAAPADASAPASAPPTTWEGPPRRVLVVDDDQLIVRAVTRTLRAAGLVVEGTTDIVEARAIVARDAPHVVVSDLHIPLACGALFLADVADAAPDTMRVLMSADPEFRPDRGSLADARVHALMSKSQLPSLTAVILEQLRGRLDVAASYAAREELARRVAHALGRPQYEDDAHRERLAVWTERIATAMGLEGAELEEARLGAILHDVGNVTVPDRAFASGGTLPDRAAEQIRRHPTAGARIVEEMPALRSALAVIRTHHERQDGSGYPDRVDGSAIPRAARAFQVADAYDAMTRGRAYRRRRSHSDAIEELQQNAGRQHDADAVRALAALGEQGLALGA